MQSSVYVAIAVCRSKAVKARSCHTPGSRSVGLHYGPMHACPCVCWCFGDQRRLCPGRRDLLAHNSAIDAASARLHDQQHQNSACTLGYMCVRVPCTGHARLVLSRAPFASVPGTATETPDVSPVKGIRTQTHRINVPGNHTKCAETATWASAASQAVMTLVARRHCRKYTWMHRILETRLH
jgi:hypothetical protein